MSTPHGRRPHSFLGIYLLLSPSRFSVVQKILPPVPNVRDPLRDHGQNYKLVRAVADTAGYVWGLRPLLTSAPLPARPPDFHLCLPDFPLSHSCLMLLTTPDFCFCLPAGTLGHRPTQPRGLSCGPGTGAGDGLKRLPKARPSSPRLVSQFPLRSCKELPWKAWCYVHSLN